MAVVLVPNVTLWRFGRTNAERWIASDPTRHMFARLWWQGLTFATKRGDDLGFDGPCPVTFTAVSARTSCR